MVLTSSFGAGSALHFLDLKDQSQRQVLTWNGVAFKKAFWYWNFVSSMFLGSQQVLGSHHLSGQRRVEFEKKAPTPQPWFRLHLKLPQSFPNISLNNSPERW